MIQNIYWDHTRGLNQMNIKWKIAVILLFTISTLINTSCNSHPNEIDIELRLDKGSKAGFFIRLDNKEYRGDKMMETFYQDLKEHMKKAPALKAVFHFEDYVVDGNIEASSLFIEHFSEVVGECFKANLRNHSFAYPKSVKRKSDEYWFDELGDVVLPKVDCYEKLVKPKDKFIILSINLRGEYMRDRKNLGPVSKIVDKIRHDLQEETKNVKIGLDGYSLLTVFLRVDREAEFYNVSKLLNICGELKINKIEFNCLTNLLHIPSIERLYWRFQEGALSFFPLETHDPENVDSKLLIQLFPVKKKIEDFKIKINDKEFQGSTMLAEFSRFIEDYNKEQPGVAVIISPNKGIRFGHVVKVMNECYRANLKKILFHF